jgi:mRNA degradation ribonuclease J1/J2
VKITILSENGDIICFEEGRAWLDGKVHTGRMLVDGKGPWRLLMIQSFETG